MATGLFICLQWCEMRSGAIDTHALAVAAGKQADAAGKFSESAKGINAGVGDAVAKLNLQAGKLAESVKQTTRLASATEHANANVINSDRPWMGANFSVEGFAADKVPTYTIIFINSGKRPARVTLTQTLSVARDYGDSPVYRPYDTTPSISVIVPGQSLLASWKGDSSISSDTMKAIASEQVPFMVYAKIEYTDIRTDTQYWTHVCS